jgi:hypothetical protein
MSLEKCLETIANNQKQGKEGKLAKKISKLEIDPSTNVRFTYSDGCDVVHYNETHHDDALEYTDVVSKLTEALTQTSAFLTDCKHVLGGCIDYGDLDEDSIPTESSLLLKGFIASGELGKLMEKAIKAAPWDAADGFLDFDLEQYDHKRGYCELSTAVDTTAQEVLRLGSELEKTMQGWTAKFEDQDGDEIKVDL